MKVTKYNVTILLIIILLLLSIVTLIMPSKTYKAYTYEAIDIESLEEFSNGDYLEQTFVANDNYSYIGIPIATYGTLIEKGKLFVTIINENGKEKKYTVNINSVIDSQNYYFRYNVKKNKKYIIKITAEKLSSPVSFTLTNAKIENANLKLNGEELDENIILSFMNGKKNYFNIWYYLLIISVLSSYAIIIKENK